MGGKLLAGLQNPDQSHLLLLPQSSAAQSFSRSASPKGFLQKLTVSHESEGLDTEVGAHTDTETESFSLRTRRVVREHTFIWVGA